MTQTGNRWASGSKKPGDFTGTQGVRLREKIRADQKAREDIASIDVAAIRESGRQAGFSQGWDAAIAWVIEKMTDVGVDPDILVVADDDEHQDDDGEDE
jgi:hypothetical protein